MFAANIFGYIKYMVPVKKKGSVSLILKKYPYIKYWMVLVCMTLIPISIYKIMTSSDITYQGYLFFLCFFSIIGPLFVANEIERFLSLGK